jgi:hypothetical protein
LTLKEPKAGQFWGYLFSNNGAAKEEWHKLARDGTLVLDPVGKVALTCPAGDHGRCAGGKDLNVQPGLYTGDGLLITSVYLGRDMPASPFGNGPHAKIHLTASGDRHLDQATSGFA